MFKDAYHWVGKYEKCKLFVGRPQLAALPLKLVVIDRPFQEWGLDFIGPISSQSTGVHTHIIIATNYFTKWVEAIPIKRTTSKVVCDFIKENILVRYGVPHKLVTNNATSFSSSEFSLFYYDYGISISHSANYYPQGNSQAKCSNKNLVNIIKSLVSDN